MNSNFNQKSTPKKRESAKKGPKKSLGQHWLKDRFILDSIANDAEISEGDFVLEIGPGLGTLTSSLLNFAGKTGEVVCVEFDEDLAKKLPNQFPGKNLTIINEDFLKFDLATLPKDYKVAANVPYYITAKIIEKLLASENPPKTAALLVQKEVAERLAAKAGELSILAISAQIFSEVSLGNLVPKEFFTPPPKVDSQVVIFHLRPENLLEKYNQKNSLNLDQKQFFRVVKAGFSAKRKMIHKALSANLVISKEFTHEILAKANISPNVRAQDLTINDWLNLTELFVQNETV